MKTGRPRWADNRKLVPVAVAIVKSSANFGRGGRMSSSSLMASSRLSPRWVRGAAAGAAGSGALARIAGASATEGTRSV